MPDHPLLKDAIPCRAARSALSSKEGDWAVAEMRRHPLKTTVRFTPVNAVHHLADDHFVSLVGALARRSTRKSAERRSDEDT